MGQLDGLVAFITGAGRGIGRAIAEALADAGAAVALGADRDQGMLAFREHKGCRRPGLTGNQAADMTFDEQLDAHVVLPAIGEVVSLGEALMEAEPEIGETHTARVDEGFGAMLTSVNYEAMQMFVAPRERDLEGSVQIGTGTVAANEQESPYQRLMLCTTMRSL